ASRNVISGNKGGGVNIDGASGNTVVSNFIGTNAAGTAALGNGGTGVLLANGSQNNTVGGAAAAARNVISGNGFTGINSGVDLRDSGTTGNTVAGNFIGTNAAGTAALANADHGVALFFNASNNLIGGTAPGAGNLISGNTVNGIEVFDSANDNA